MWWSKEQKKVICKKIKTTYKIEIIGADYESGRDINITMDFIEKISADKNVFISTLGSILTLDRNAILSVNYNPKHRIPSTINLEINVNKINAIEPLFYNIYTNIYIFNKPMSWCDFLGIKRTNSYFNSGELVAEISLQDMDSTWIQLGEKQKIYMEDLFCQLQKEQYVIKMKR